jgi:CO/xanthine dehydrogenase FAD-binding subunit
VNRFDYYKPRSLDEVWEILDKIPGALLIAGGTDIMVKVREGEVRPPALVSLRSIQGLSGISEGDVTCIGAMTTISGLIEDPVLCRSYPVLTEAAKRLGGPQIRNAATIGGNLCNCSPCADTAPPLLVLDAKVRIQGPGGSRDMPLGEFFVGPGETCLLHGEILTDILLDPPSKSAKTAFMKKGRVKMDLATASIAVLLEISGHRCSKARIAAGSVAPVPLRLSAVEKLLEGSIISKKILARARKIAEDSVSPITDIRATEQYRRQIIGVYVERCIEGLVGGGRI